MSWIVQHILRNRESIRAARDIESDEYDNLLVIESKMNNLRERGFLSDIDCYIIDLVADGRPIRNLEVELDKGRIAISKTFIQICSRISYFLGGYFTDDGFLENIRINYRLKDSDIEELRLYTTGKFKHRLMRKKINETTNVPSSTEKM